MAGSKNVIESSLESQDRLSVFFHLFALSVVPLAASDGRSANLLISQDADGSAWLVLAARGGCELGPGVRASARIDFESLVNPLMRALPDMMKVPLHDNPALATVADAFARECGGGRCGAPLAADYLGRLLLLMALRHAIESGVADAGLLAALGHPHLYPALVAIHQNPERQWRSGDLAGLGGISRTQFMTLFARIVGTTPIAYLNSWRLALGRRELEKGARIKTVARQVGYGSAAAFSRAYARAFGHAPIVARNQTS
ncbi:helix-turn-helix transcriptional regulator [Bosea sp. R86505]|uniref:helix-turn-helix transcriptional regulator n=1 Tax=Bosea sp. R86505 TaxID=3101710 RepID=UPI003671ABF0